MAGERHGHGMLCVNRPLVSSCPSVSLELNISMVNRIGQAARKRRTQLMNCVLLPGTSVRYECV